MFEELLERMKLDHSAVTIFLEIAGLDSSEEFSVTVNMMGENSPRREKISFKPNSRTMNILHYVVQKIGNVERMERLEIRRADGTGGFACVFPRQEEQIEFK